MTSKLWIDGGAGADVMTGGSGVNDYIYGSTSDSTPTASDIITNFHAASDLLDFTGLGAPLSSAHITTDTTGKQTLAPHSFAWQATGGNTFVYVNAGSSSVAVGAANMEIELQGYVPLSSGNFLHL
jgi:Ca2+-binding RTX toxin-like protein